MILNSFIKDVQPLVIFTLHLVILDQQNILMYSYFQAPSSIYVYTVYIYIYIYIISIYKMSLYFFNVKKREDKSFCFCNF